MIANQYRVSFNARVYSPDYTIFMWSTGWALQFWGIALKSLSHEFFFFRKKFGLSYTKASSDRRKVSKYLTLSFLGPKVLLFCLKSVQWTGNELAGDDEENCENS